MQMIQIPRTLLFLWIRIFPVDWEQAIILIIIGKKELNSLTILEIKNYLQNINKY